MKKIIKQEMREINGTIYEIKEIEDTVEHEEEEFTRRSIRILKTPYGNQEVEVTDDTKSLIDKISKGSSK